MGNDYSQLVGEIAACRLCDDLPLGPRPVLRTSMSARILIAGQAPGLKVHNSGIPFDDPSGDRLRDWMGVDRNIFYDASLINIVPMAFCYPGRAPKGGDLPPRKECRQAWHDQLYDALPQQELTLVIGQYAQDYHLGGRRAKTLTETVRAWRDFQPSMFPIPHPSPRNNIWLARNPWFEAEVVPELRRRIMDILGGDILEKHKR